MFRKLEVFVYILFKQLLYCVQNMFMLEAFLSSLLYKSKVCYNRSSALKKF